MTIIHGESFLTLATYYAADTFDAAIGDPPYALVSIGDRLGNPDAAPIQYGTDGAYARAARGFMGKTWDTGEVAFNPAFWREVLRVLKPGAHLVMFGGSRTYHRLACAIEDAGFEIRDQIQWLYGSGFPKNLDVALMFEKRHCEKIGEIWVYSDSGADMRRAPPFRDDLANEFAGWGSALKPAHEPIVLARKPFKSSIADNMDTWGTGGINIDGCRVEGAAALYGNPTQAEGWRLNKRDIEWLPSELGRWPANVIHDGSPEVLAAFPNAPGQQGDLDGQSKGRTSRGIYGDLPAERQVTKRGDSGSAARFFYTAKASKADREEGLEHFALKAAGMRSDTSGQHITRRDEGYTPPERANNHPTVKPTSLMRYLCKLITPVGGHILDPFAGSGSTGKAAALEGFKFTGIEMDPNYVEIARARIAWAKERYDKI